MKGLENSTYLLGLIISNLVAIIMIWAAIKQPRIARAMLALLFGWACWINWTTAINSPKVYLEYAELAVLPIYSQWISGWFSSNITLYVGIIATCQGMIAISMLLKGFLLKMGAIGAIIFLLAIMPLGVGSAFPATLIMAIAIMYLLRHEHDYLWYGRYHKQAMAH